MDQAYSASVAADGRGIIRIRTTARQRWEVSQVTCDGPASGAEDAYVAKNGAIVAPFLPSGSDVVSGPPNVQIGPSDVLTVEWIDATPGESIGAFVIYDVIPE